MIHDIMPGTEEELLKGPSAAYVGIDPTGDSLHIGHLVSIMILKHFQACGHKPVALVGGATGMIGDPSMKSQERNLLDEQTLAHNVDCIKKQLGRFLDFESDAPNKAVLVNNYDWMKDYTFINFTRDIGKLITVNYMMSKDSVKKRLSRDSSEGMSFTEFTYQLLQGYDFLYLYQNMGVKLQLGGAGKFGKTEKGNIWLDADKTTPYEFYQFWLNVSDDDACKYIKIFTMLDRATIEAAIEEHLQDPGRRSLQKLLAKEVTVMVHGQKEYDNALAASQMLFGNSTSEALRALDEKTFLSVFAGVPTFDIARADLPLQLLDMLAVQTSIFPSKGEARKMVQGGGVSINKDKITDLDRKVSEDDILDGKYILVQKGKKNYYIINVK